MVLVAYLGVVYVPFALLVGILWFVAASVFRKMRGWSWRAGMRKSAKEAFFIVLFVVLGLLFLGMAAFLSGF